MRPAQLAATRDPEAGLFFITFILEFFGPEIRSSVGFPYESLMKNRGLTTRDMSGQQRRFEHFLRQI